MRPYHDMVEKAKAYFISDLREEEMVQICWIINMATTISMPLHG